MVETFKKIGIYAGIVLLLAGIAYGFVPQVLDGKIVNQSDIAGWKGMAQEALEYNKANPDDPTAWTGSMFGGMPTTAITDNFEGDWTKPLYKFIMMGKRPGSYLFVTLLGAFLLMLSLGTSKTLAVAGAIAVAFCSYNMQIIQVGHNTKMQAIAFFPWVLAGVIFTYKAALGGQIRKWLPKTVLGAVLFSLALSMQIKANHIQITYYLAIVIFVYAIGLLIYLCARRKDLLKRFFSASALLLVIGCIGIATNANKLIPTYEYTPYTMRGGSELSSDSDSHNDKGLDLDYATAWSYGIGEMPNLLIPNFNGGASAGELDIDSETGKLLKRAGQPNLRQTLKQMPLYWGPQPFTAGPMYMGAITIFLFVLGLILLKGREKWWILTATLIAVLLSWGSHFMWFTKLWFEYAPFYNKFRTVSMSLIVLQVTLPMLGFYALDKVLKGGFEGRKLMKACYISYGVTAGFCLLCAVAPGVAGTFTGAVDAGQPDVLVDALVADRKGLLKADAIRSFVLITICFALIVWAVRGGKGYVSVGDSGSRYKMTAVGAAVALIVLFDMFSVGKRFLNSDHFITPKNFEAQYEPRPVDQILFEDADPDFRVLDISINTFNSSLASYHHKTIGGYSPVKLQRYQDLIDKYITPEIRQIYDVVGNSATVQEVSENLPELKITSLLNGKYIILGGEFPPVRNPYAMGHCWFVDNFVEAPTPDDEIAMLGAVNLKNTAVIGSDFGDVIKRFPDTTTPSDTISLNYYAPNELRYSFSTSAERAAVFSEIFYPKGWKAWIEPAGKYGKVQNGHYKPTPEAKPVDIFRADWILRGAIIPEGEGELIMRFEPDSYLIGENISRASSISLILLLLLSTAGMLLTRKDRIRNV
ncbi:MAG: hypothetical protein E7116_07530 [Bacteroidales bacterium]|nr:hypothetical protein [Bacteroidales bacterium]